jgi:6-carboxyhexanoate--CoA ligase
MRATLDGKHVSGQERIVKKDELQKTILELHTRPKGEWDFQTIKVERLKNPPEVIEKSLPVKDYKFSCIPLAVNFAATLLENEHKIPRSKVKQLFAKLSSGFKNGENLPGAVLVDVESGEVLAEGIRTILFDWKNREAVRSLLLEKGFTERTLDALALATKNVYCGVEAEICISDDPDYTTGYIASPKLGYIRISPLKERGNPYGGRIYFVKKSNLQKVIECLRQKAVLIEKPNL